MTYIHVGLRTGSIKKTPGFRWTPACAGVTVVEGVTMMEIAAS